MTNEQQPEALRLADRLTPADYYEFDASLHCPQAAAELRRLHAENSDYGATIDYLTSENAEQIGEIVALKEQRDELLAALRKLHHGLDECDMVHDDQRSAYANASAIIAKATGETK